MREILVWTMKNLMHIFNEEEIHIIVGYQWQKFRAYSKNLFINLNWEHTNIMGSLFCARELLSRHKCLVIYADIFFEENAINLITQSQAPSVLNIVNCTCIKILNYLYLQ